MVSLYMKENLLHLDVLDDVKEVNSGFECGLNIENYNDIKEGDIIEGYVMEEVEKK